MAFFGSSNRSAGLFGSGSTGGGLWGSGSTGGFGGGTSTSGFGSGNSGGWGKTGDGGVFGSGTSGGGGGGWGTGGGTGGSASGWGTSTAGGQGWGSGSGWGGSSTVRKGTRDVPYRPMRDPADSTGKVRFENITFMPEYSGKSQEELRYEDYAKGDHGGRMAPGGSGFGSGFGSSSSGGLFGQQSSDGGWGSSGGTLFGAASAPGFGTQSSSGPSLFGGPGSGFGAKPSGGFGSGFGNPGFGASSASEFSKPAASGFGSTPSGFGGASSGFGPSSGSAFGGGGFGAKPTGFGGTGTSGLGAASTPGFGSSSASPFGATTSGFGVSTTTPFDSKPTGGFGAGAGGFGEFGAKASSGFGGGSFGAPSGGRSIFGSTPSTSGLFGSSTGSDLFGSKPSPGFGATGSGLFGRASKPLFGTGASSGGSLFGGGASAFGGGAGGLFGAQSGGSSFGKPSSGFGAQPAEISQGPLTTSLVDNPFGTSKVIDSITLMGSTSTQPPTTSQPSPGATKSATESVSVVVGPRSHPSTVVPVRRYGPRRSALFRVRRQPGRPFAPPGTTAAEGIYVPERPKSRAATIKKLIIDPKFQTSTGSPDSKGRGASTSTGFIANHNSGNRKLTLVLTRNGSYTRHDSESLRQSSDDGQLQNGTKDAGRDSSDVTEKMTDVEDEEDVAANGEFVPGESLSPGSGLRRNIFKSPMNTPAAYHMPAQGISPTTGRPKVYSDYRDFAREQRQARSATEVPVLAKDDYYTVPSIHELKSFTSQQLSAVREFTVGREGFGKVVFPGPTDVRNLNLDEIVEFEDRSVIFYGGCERPKKGTGLNKQAVVTLEGIWSRKGGKPKKGAAATAKMVKKLKNHCVEHGLEFLGYDDTNGGWTFAIEGTDEG